MLIANRAFTFGDFAYRKGDEVTPEPDPVSRARLVRAGFVLTADTLEARVGGLGCVCGFVGVTRRALDAHRAAAHPVTEPAESAAPLALAPDGDDEPSFVSSPSEVSCPECAREFVSVQGLRIHRARQHGA